MGCSCSDQRHINSDGSSMIPCHDYKELEEYTGTGVKRTRAWSGTITQSQLKMKRDKFWASNVTGHMFIWLQIKQAVEADSANAETILQYAGVRMVYDNIQICKDFEGNRYVIPVFVINDPVQIAESDIEDIDDSMIIELTLRQAKHPDTSVCIPLAFKVKQLKDEIGLPQSRLFYGGKELYDYRKLSEYNVQDGIVIQVFNPDKYKK